MKETNQVLNEIKYLISQKGFIYSFCMILFEDFHINPETLHEINYRKRLSTKEAFLILGFMIQKEIDFSFPDSFESLIQNKQKIYDLMEELHSSSIMNPLAKYFQNIDKQKVDQSKLIKAIEDPFSKGYSFIEPFFYSGTGAYDFQYRDFLDKKYKYDQQWLLKNKDFKIDDVKNILLKTKEIIHEKSKRVHLHPFRDNTPEIDEKSKNDFTEEEWSEFLQKALPMLDLFQYRELFFDTVLNLESANLDYIKEESWHSFYNNLIDLFVVKKSDFDGYPKINSFIENFSLSCSLNTNTHFQSVGNFNLLNARPIIRIDDSRYFIPNLFLLYEAVYESPFYWMIVDEEYNSISASNRGKVGEEITFEMLVKVFGPSRIFKSVKIQSPKNSLSTSKIKDETDIDVLCVLGSKALCVQVKSKKLTELARMGNDEKLQIDFQEAIKDAYDQGLIARKAICERDSKFLDENGKIIKLSEEIDEVYIMCITTENFPSITNLSSRKLSVEKNNPYPITLTIFDLEFLIHYLNDPYDFLYYIRQRISLMNYFHADEEAVFLGYHLNNKLWKIPENDWVYLTPDFGQLLDRNYFPLKAGISVSDKGDKIKNRWKNEGFDQLCNCLKTFRQAKITDIIFYLLDWSEEARKILVDSINQSKNATLMDGHIHDFSLPAYQNSICCFGFSYLSLNSNDPIELQNKLLLLCQARKYKCKSNAWIGFGSLKNSPEIIDLFIYSDEKWKYDNELEKMSNDVLKNSGRKNIKRFGKKPGRNDPCNCGSGIKYKNCCGKIALY